MDLQKEFSTIKNDLGELKSLLLKQSDSLVEAEQILNIKECSKLLSLSVPTLYSYVQSNKIPYSKHGHKLMFLKSSIISWIKDGKVKTLSELENEADTYLSNKS